MQEQEYTHDFPDTDPDHAPIYNANAQMPWLPPSPLDARD